MRHMPLQCVRVQQQTMLEMFSHEPPQLRLTTDCFKLVPQLSIPDKRLSMKTNTHLLTSLFALTLGTLVWSSENSGESPTVFEERDGIVAVEAEHFFEQTETDVRKFHVTTANTLPEVTPDGDPPHLEGVCGDGYLEILPDTRRTHSDKLIRGENFTPKPGQAAVVKYKVFFSTPGRYYVWVRAYSTGTEDNGLHVGIDGTWPESGQRMQWCQGKKRWHWESKQRTEQEHCGEPYKIYLDVDKPGEHEIQFSMREDGFEFDKWIMTTDRDFVRPLFAGSRPIIKR